MNVIRYSQGFKLQAVKEVESGKSCAWAVGRKYNIKGGQTVMRWVRQYGSGKYGKLIRVEKADEVNEAARLKPTAPSQGSAGRCAYGVGIGEGIFGGSL